MEGRWAEIVKMIVICKQQAKTADTKINISPHIIHDFEQVFPSIQYFVVSISLSFYLLVRMIYSVGLSKGHVHIETTSIL